MDIAMISRSQPPGVNDRTFIVAEVHSIRMSGLSRQTFMRLPCANFR
jgi:hypothetical protein